MRHLRLALVVAALWPLAAAAEENWPRLRGADATGVVADDTRLPDEWDRQTNVKWTAEIPGFGWSSPVVWGDRVFVTSVHTDQPGEAPKAGLYLGQGRAQPPPGVHHWMVYCLSL